MPMSITHRRRVVSQQSAPLALAAVCLVVALAGCGQTVSALRPTPGVTATPTPSATATPLPTPVVTALEASGPPVSGDSVTWMHANLPDGFGMAFHASDLGVAPSDGSVAYSCGVPAGATDTRVVVTRDGGTTWVPAAALPGAWSGGCQSVTLDQINPALVVVCCGAGAGNGPAEAISADGGMSWRLSGGAQGPLVQALATRGARTYAILRWPAGNGTRASLETSDDGLQTWRPVDTNLQTTDYSAFWLDRGSGDLLLESWPGGGAFQLWRTADDGARWSEIALPMRDASNFAARYHDAAGGGAWEICGTYNPSTTTPGDGIVCTGDIGRTWTLEPPLAPTGGAPTFASIAGLAPDGSVLAYDSSSPRGIYRLPSGATRWQALGKVPAESGGGVWFAPTPANHGATLWSVPAESDGAGAPDPATAVYTAVYPY